MKKLGILSLLVAGMAMLLLTGCECKHDWKEAACTTAKVCKKCGLTEGEPLSHMYGEYVEVKPATCKEEGMEEKTCSICGDVKTVSIPTKNHTFGEAEIVDEPSCTEEGLEKRTCTECGEVEKTTIPAKGHVDDGTGYCAVCGVIMPIEMTEADKEIVRKVDGMSCQYVFIDYENDDMVLVFALEDEDQTRMSVPCMVDVKIADYTGKVVFKDTVYVYRDNYGMWPADPDTSEDVWVAEARIPYDEMDTAELGMGTITYVVYNPGYFKFPTAKMDIIGLKTE